MGEYTRLPLLPALLVALSLAGGIALRHDALDGVLLADDYDHYAMQRGLYPAPRGPLDTYDFVASPRERSTLMAHGRLPWWSDEDLQLSVLRPLSSALTWGDYRFYGVDSQKHHLHSFVWWALLVMAAAGLFHALLPLPAALTASALFVLEEGHNLPVAWAANRNELVALSLATLALWAYVRAQLGPGSAPRWLAPLLLALAFAGGEHALPLVAYFVGYELFAAQDGWAQRARRLAPIGAVALGYLGLRAALGHGIAGSGFYVSPFGTPLRFAGELAWRLPLLLGDGVLGLGAEWYMTGPPYARDVLSLGLLPKGAVPLPQWQPIQLGLAIAVTLAVAVALSSRRAMAGLGAALGGGGAVGDGGGAGLARFFLGSAVLALVPACAALPMSRLTLPAALGLDALLGAVLVWAATALVRARGARRMLAVLLLSSVVLVHGVHAGRRAYLDARYFRMRSVLDAYWAEHAELDDARVGEQRVLVIAARDWVSHFVVPFARHAIGLHMPRSVHLLSGSTANPHELSRSAPDALELRVLGHPQPGSFLGSVYRPLTSPMRPGDVVALPSMRVTVLATSGGQPTHMRFSFGAPLDPARDVLLYSFESGMRQVALPRIGDKRRLPVPADPRPLD